MKLYTNNSWTEVNANGYVSEAIAWSENGNHATIYSTGNTAEEAHIRLMNALRELKLEAEISTIGDVCTSIQSENPDNASGGDEVETDER